VNPSSETETRSRGRSALDRGEASHERGRPAPKRGGVPLEGSPTLERDGTSLEGAADPRTRRIVSGHRHTPRAERSSARGWPG
jgi:hypothetical protein